MVPVGEWGTLKRTLTYILALKMLLLLLLLLMFHLIRQLVLVVSVLLPTQTYARNN